MAAHIDAPDAERQEIDCDRNTVTNTSDEARDEFHGVAGRRD
jgi:hypothetical protein